MTLAEFLALPEQKPELEFIDGVVRQKVAARPLRACIQFLIAKALDDVAVKHRLGIVLPEIRFVSDRWAPVPDVGFYRRERLNVRRAPADFRQPPDLAVEVMSPGQKLPDQMQKCLNYVERGTVVAVLVQPEDSAVFVFRSDQPLLILQGDDRIDLDDILPGFELTVRSLFEAANWSWLDDDAEVHADADAGQADDAAAPGRSDD
jgi:Uma2 family endonuclease